MNILFVFSPVGRISTGELGQTTKNMNKSIITYKIMLYNYAFALSGRNTIYHLESRALPWPRGEHPFQGSFCKICHDFSGFSRSNSLDNSKSRRLQPSRVVFLLFFSLTRITQIYRICFIRLIRAIRVRQKEFSNSLILDFACKVAVFSRHEWCFYCFFL